MYSKCVVKLEKVCGKNINMLDLKINHVLKIFIKKTMASN